MPYITEERRMIQEQAREFTLNEVLPVANKLDPEKGDIPMDLRDKMAELGYFGILIPEQYGGLGLGCFEYCLVTEELSRGWMSVASLIARGNLLIGSHMMSEEQRARYLPRMAKGEFLGAFSMSEPNAGSDISNISCRARKDGTGYLISGNKYWCTFADGADFLIIIARTSDAPPGKRHLGLSMFFVEKKRGTLPKGCNGAPIPKIGYFGWKTYELAFDNFRVEAADMIGEEGQAFYYATSGLETARAHTAARAIGLAQGALDDSIRYAGERRSSSGRSPTSRRSASRSPRWRPRSRRRASSTTSSASRSTPASAATRKRRWQAVRVGDGRAGLQRGHPDPRRRGLHHPARRRAPLARRPADQDLRGHVGDPEAHHLRPPARPREELMKVSALTGQTTTSRTSRSATC
jgi:alkylation response protein AidB-like acyl-CoA dehydrogenase